ncbi:2-amino-4-hydroxy-6-hydroxymethyldihydropteridine diphosphokinase [Planctobacterium marinum]|uniref:2-amino-4-hydroxy-6- hydroxymethyldihydropteridine diphosphokinase n=1 Tax=Planctobacterium marinum TaxID=1631968 RepID=UPI001E52C089|nr:2-amino-4-hydroxy-6-hydroxymethyldihydropteridine diphosphokinase [Planctobacterium marinum]MCC2606647.1 2-amino-4-hydroxy-6-hydroxymethyldihydropteridine diphosphokinase [Planctobacterium marinum]
MTREIVYIGLGANLNNPVRQLHNALSAIKRLPDTQLLKHSGFYSSTPLGPSDQPEYVNAVAAISSLLTPEALLKALQNIELEQGRTRKAERWGPRTLDLDIILFGQRVINTEHLTVPHYHFQHREFVLYPLYEIAPQLSLPDGSTVRQRLQAVPKNGLTELLAAKNIQIA